MIINLLLGALLGSTPIYRWVDEQGTVHLSDRVPPGIEAAPVNAPPENVVDAWKGRPIGKVEKLRAKPIRPRRPAALETRQQKAAHCRQARQEFEAVRQQLRSGYQASEGRKLKSLLRQAQDDIRSHCGRFR